MRLGKLDTALQSDQNALVGQAVLRLAQKWFLVAPANDIVSAARLLTTVINNGHRSHAIRRSAVEMLTSLATRFSECAGGQNDLVHAIGIHVPLFAHEPIARETVQRLVLTLVSIGHSDVAATCTARLNGGIHAHQKEWSYSAEMSQQIGGGDGIIASSVADEVSASADERRVEGCFVDATSRYLKALKLYPAHINSLLGLLALAEDFGAERQDTNEILNQDLTMTNDFCLPKDGVVLAQGLLTDRMQQSLVVCHVVLEHISSQKCVSGTVPQISPSTSASPFANTRIARLREIHVQAANLFLDILKSAKVENLLSIAWSKPQAEQDEALLSNNLGIKNTPNRSVSNVEVVSTKTYADDDIDSFLLLFEQLLVHIAAQRRETMSHSASWKTFDATFLRAASAVLNIAHSIVSFATGRATHDSLYNSHAVDKRSTRWRRLLATADVWFSKLLSHLSERWINVVFHRCSEGAQNIRKESNGPPPDAFALHTIESSAYCGLMDIRDAKVAAAADIFFAHSKEVHVKNFGENRAPLLMPTIAMKLLHEADCGFDVLLDHLTVAEANSATVKRPRAAPLPTPVVLTHLMGVCGPIVRGWWTPIGLVHGNTTDNASFVFSSTYVEHSTRTDAAVDSTAWETADASTALNEFKRLQWRALNGALRGAERRAYASSEVSTEILVCQNHVCDHTCWYLLPLDHGNPRRWDVSDTGVGVAPCHLLRATAMVVL